MAARGHYAKGVAKRAEILQAALQVISENGYSRATVKELADAVGLSQNGLLHYFGSKDALFAEILRHRDEVDAARFEAGDGGGLAGGDAAGGDDGSSADGGRDGAAGDAGPDGRLDRERAGDVGEGRPVSERADDDDDARAAVLIERLTDVLRHNAGVPGLVQLYARLANEASEADHPAHEFFRERYANLRELGRRGIVTLQAEGRIRPDLDPEVTAVMLFALADGLQTQWMYDPDLDMAEATGQFLHLIGLDHP